MTFKQGRAICVCPGRPAQACCLSFFCLFLSYFPASAVAAVGPNRKCNKRSRRLRKSCWAGVLAPLTQLHLACALSCLPCCVIDGLVFVHYSNFTHQPH